MSIKLYAPRMGSGSRCHWLLNELGLTYENPEVNMQNGDHKSEWFLKINPVGQVPAIDIDGFVMAESYAINDYLVNKYKPELNGATLEEKAKGFQWSLFCLFNLQEEFGTLLMPRWTGKNDPVAEEKAKDALTKKLPILEAYLNGKDYLSGKGFTVHDINAASGFTYAKMLEYDLNSYPNISAWLERCMTRPACVAVTKK